MKRLFSKKNLKRLSHALNRKEVRFVLGGAGTMAALRMYRRLETYVSQTGPQQKEAQ
jgi:hypothetical protein